jgi:hypothetical protein
MMISTNLDSVDIPQQDYETYLQSFISSRQILPLKFVRIKEAKDLATSCFLFVKHAKLYTVRVHFVLFFLLAELDIKHLQANGTGHYQLVA